MWMMSFLVQNYYYNIMHVKKTFFVNCQHYDDAMFFFHSCLSL